MTRSFAPLFAAGLAALGALGAASARADGPRAAVTLIPQYQQECAACHIAYPPNLLPPASWQRLMQNLPRHFGTDASLDAATVQVLATWLAGTSARTSRMTEAPPEDRITQSRWFVREHRKVAAATWKLPAVKSPSNCAACHTGAPQGDFDEHSIRIPR